MWASRAIAKSIPVLVSVLASVAWCQPINPVILVDNVDGVNGQASGAPGGTAAVFLPLGCATTGASTTIQAPAHGMSGFPTNGSSALWLNTGSGRRWSKVTGFPSGDTITVQDSFNIGVAVNCAIGGEIAGTLANVTRLCQDLKFGWTVEIQNRGVDYTDSGSCPILTSTAGAGHTGNGRVVIRGDDPDNPTRILWQTNGNYFTNGGVSPPDTKLENLRFSKDTAAGTSGELTNGGNLPSLLKNIITDNNQGTWTNAYGALLGSPSMILSSRFSGPYTVNCTGANDQDMIIANYFDGCSGSTTAFLPSTAGLPLLFNIIDQQGANLGIIASAVNNGFTGLALYNTLLAGGATGIGVGSNAPTIVSGNFIDQASTLSGACWNGGAGSSNWFGGSGEVHTIWGGNGARLCPTARYSGGINVTTVGAATDLNAGLTIDAQFQDEPSLDYFPLNAELKSSLVFPGLDFPLLTPALPTSTMTAGAPQRPGGGGVSGYAF